MHLLDVGQDQGILIEADGSIMLLDGGGRNTSSFVVTYLKQQRVENLDFVAVSHYDEDHMSGVIGALAAFPCQELLLPTYTVDTDLFESFAKTAISNGCSITHARAGSSFQLGSATVELIAPIYEDYETENDRSLGFRICYGNTSFLICGDAEQQSELDMVGSMENISADVYVADHHGVSTSSMDAFLDAVSPKYAMISCGMSNPYGHPSMETLQRLQNRNISLYRTDVQGTIIAYSDGEEIWFNTDPCMDWSSGKMAEPDTRAFAMEEQSEEVQEFSYNYVCNTNTKKFLYPDCRSVDQMKETNRLYTDKSREELIAEGYEPCGSCQP